MTDRKSVLAIIAGLLTIGHIGFMQRKVSYSFSDDSAVLYC